VEYVYGIFVDNVVNDFQGISTPVKTNQQVFVSIIFIIFFQFAILTSSVKREADIRFAYTMFESRRIELNYQVHRLNR